MFRLEYFLEMATKFEVAFSGSETTEVTGFSAFFFKISQLLEVAIRGKPHRLIISLNPGLCIRGAKH